MTSSMTSSPVSPLRSPDTDSAHTPVELRGVAAALGWDLYPWQQHAASLIYGPSRLVVISTPRRSGKTALMTSVLSTTCVVRPGSQVFYTEQTREKAAEWYRDYYKDRLVASVIPAAAYRTRDSAGSESVKWKNQSLLKVFGPEGDLLHGKDADLVIADEVWKRTRDQGDQLLGAANPAGSRRPTYTFVAISTVGASPSGWLYDLMHDPDTDVLHYGCPPDVDPMDATQWPTWHPGFEDPDPVVRQTLAASITTDVQLLGETEWLRAYANRWPQVSTSGSITNESWQAVQLDDIGDRADDLTVAFDCAWDRSSASVVASWTDTKGHARLEVVEHRPGVRWLADYLTDVHQRLGPPLMADSGSPARDIIRALQSARVPVTELPTGDYAAACARFVEAVVDRVVHVRPDPVLDTAVTAARRRNVGDRWLWDRRTRTDISALTAATGAAWPALAPTAEPLLI